MSDTYNKALVVVTVGGDHHPFDRLMRWVEAWMVDESCRVRCLAQHGPARAPVGAEALEFLDHADLLTAMAAARAVVASGGPTTLAEARRLGHRPIVVPRRAAYGEHVDDHQQTFAKRLHDMGLVVAVETEGDFRTALSWAIDAPRVVPDAEGITSLTVARVGNLIEATVRQPQRSRLGNRSRAVLHI
jgi:UDP-N-acetylglucosamine transferase subunit ALG13